ncbi:MAG: adenylate kinase [Dehalococcoidia bacterium]
MPIPGRRIAVVGPSGSGKTYVAKALAARLGLQYVCNDELIWRPHWTPTPEDERLALHVAALAGDAWTFDGNFGSLAKPEDRHVLARIDTLVWLDLPRWRVFVQLLWRTVRRAVTREELWHGNRESFRLSFLSRDSILWWSMKSYRRRRQEYARMFADPALAHLRRVRLRSRREVDAWLASIGDGRPMG